MKTVSINALQFATLNALRDCANENGVIPHEVVAGYKQNVVLALVAKGALKAFNKHYKVPTNVEIVERAPHVHRESTLIKMAERAAAPRNPVGRPRLVRDEQAAA